MSQALRSQLTTIKRGALTAVPAVSLTGLTTDGVSLATATTSAAHNLTNGAQVTITGAIPSAYNGLFTVTVTGPETFTFTTPNVPSGPATVDGSYVAQNVNYATCEEASNIKFGGITVSAIDVTHLQSLAKEFIPGLRDSGSCDVSCNFINGPVQQLMRIDQNNGTVSPYQVVIPTYTVGPAGTPIAATPITFSFLAFLTKFAGPDAKVDGKLEIMMTMKITGAIVQS